jgi:glutathione S-transferase
MKLYGNPGSTCTRKVLMTFAEKGVTPELEVIDLATGQHKSGDHLARQPFGQVPVLDDGAFRLYESRAICRYLDGVLPGPSLVPADAKERAVMEQWISVETSNFTPHAMGIIYQAVFAPMRGGKADEAKVSESRAKLQPAADVLDKNLAGKKFLLGDAFTLADISYMPYLEYLAMTPAIDVVTSRPNLASWWERLRSRPTWQKVTGKA